MDLLILSDVSQVDHIASADPGLFIRMRPVTADMAVASELERLQVPFIEEWDYLTASDIERNWNRSFELSSHLWRELDGDTEYLGFPLTEAARNEMTVPFEACLNAGVIYERLCGKNAIDRIHGFFLQPVPLHRGGPLPASRAVTSVTQGVLFWIAAHRGIPVMPMTSLVPLAHAGRSQTAPVSKRIFRRAGEEYASIPELVRADRLAVIFKPGMPGIEFSALARSFTGKKDWKIAALSQMDLDAGAAALPGNVAFELKMQRAWDRFEASLREYTGPHPEIFCNPHVRFQFKRVWDEMIAAARVGEWFASYVDAVEPSLFILGHDSFTLERVLVRVARSKAVPTISLLHGGFAHVRGFRGVVGDADQILVWNDSDKHILMKFGVSEHRIIHAGALRYEKAYDAYRSHSSYGEQADKSLNKAGLNLPPDKPVVLLITSAVNTGMAMTISDQRIHRRTMREIAAMAARRTDLTFVIKPHPSYDHFEYLRRLVKQGPKNIVLLENVNLHDMFLASDISVMVNYCTTAGLEAMLSRVPLVYLKSAVYAAESSNDVPPQDCAKIIRSVADLEGIIDAWKQGREFFRSEMARTAAALPRLLLDDCESAALKRTMQELERLAAIRSPAQHAEPVREDRSPGRELSMAVKDHLQSGASTVLSVYGKSGLTDRAAPERRGPAMNNALLSAAHTVGSFAARPSDISRTMKTILRSIKNDQSVSRSRLSRILMYAYVTASVRSAQAGRTAAALLYIFHACLRHPREMLAFPRIFRRYVVRNVLRSLRRRT